MQSDLLAGSFERLPGEVDMISIVSSHGPDSIVLLFPCEDDNEPIFTSMFVTNYRLLLTPQRAGRAIAPIDLPLMMLVSWKPSKHSTVGPADVHKRRADRQVVEYFCVELVTKHMWNFRVGFVDEREFITTRKLLDSMRPPHLQRLPAFEVGQAQHKQWAEEGGAARDIGWNFFDVDAELQRQVSLDPTSPMPSIEEAGQCGVGVDLRNWFRTTTLGQKDNQFGVSPTYPFKIVVPNAASEKLLMQSLECRSRARIPAISFVNLATGGCLARASQPLKKKNCYADGKLLQYLIGTYTPASARPRDEDVAGGSPDRATPLSTATASRLQQPQFQQQQQQQQQQEDQLSGSPNAGSSSSAGMAPPSLMDDGPSLSSSRSKFVPPSLFEPESPRRGGGGRDRGNGTEDAAVAAGGTASPSFQSPHRTSFVPQRFINAVDCRPKAAAIGNEAMGGGYESGPHYEQCRVKFYSIDNIHGVTASFNKVKALLTAHNGHLPKGDFYSQWHDTQWMVHIQRVLVCSKEIVEMLMRGESAVVHCTDGWDRTSQCTSLAMLMLDPYFRTIRGFGVLIEKEWCAFGHKFAERNSHEVRGDTYCQVDAGMTASDVDSQTDLKQHKLQPSPIFLQWLDCVYQVIRQFPSQFEFTPSFLQFLCRCSYSCHYGTFLTNTAKERVFEGVKLRTVSLWTAVEDLVQQERSGQRPLCFVNRDYDAATAIRFICKEVACGILPLIPCISSKRLVLWEENYLQFDADTWATELGSGGSTAFSQRQLQQRHLVAAATNGNDDPVDASERLGTEACCSAAAAPAAVPATGLALPREMQEYMDTWASEAAKRRETEVAHMRDVVTRLEVRGRPPQSAAQERMQRDMNAKHCWVCHQKFGWFVNKEFCSECNVALCGKCVIERGPKRICKNCDAMDVTFDD